MNTKPWTRSLAAGIAGAALLSPLCWPDTAAACGGFFCAQNAPVNQAAERIIFADDGEGNVTAIIQIMYEGPSESFSWLLPITSVPTEDDLGVASDLAFDRLQQATNPQYNLTTRVEGECRDQFSTNGGAGAGTTGGFFGDGGSTDAEGGDRGVTVEASGVVGPFDWVVISFDASLPDAADAATVWLEENGYDVGEGAPGMIRPYLQDGLNLLALRLTKGADTGSIRPLRLTYPAELPMIPIKLTAVAANDDMGVMTWVLQDARAVPQNYLSLELNEARINWFNAGPTYNDVVTAAADEASGQGFVTEYAAATGTLGSVVWSPSDDNTWESFSTRRYSSFRELFDESFWRYGSWDGYWDAVLSTVTLPPGVPEADFRLCPDCYSDQVSYSPSAFIAALERDVIKPVRDVQDLLDDYSYVTRLYTTMSAAEMTVDPVFTFNPDLEDVDNIHSAERIIECNPDVYQWEAPWRIELPQGGEVRGGPDDVGTWPADFDTQPANARILRMSESGAGRVVEDRLEDIRGMLQAYNEAFPSVDGGASTGGSSGGSTGTSGGANGGSGGGSDAGSDGAAGETGGGGGCSAARGPAHGAGLGLLLAGLGVLCLRRRHLQR